MPQLGWGICCSLCLCLPDQCPRHKYSGLLSWTLSNHHPVLRPQQPNVRLTPHPTLLFQPWQCSSVNQMWRTKGKVWIKCANPTALHMQRAHGARPMVRGDEPPAAECFVVMKAVLPAIIPKIISCWRWKSKAAPRRIHYAYACERYSLEKQHKMWVNCPHWFCWFH